MENAIIYKLKPFSGKIFSEVAAPAQKFDPYLVIRHGASSFYTAVSKNTGKFPYWNDSFTFKKVGDEKISVECWDYNVDFDIEKEAALGKGLIDQSKCITDKKTLLWISIERTKPGSKEEIEKTCELLIEIEVCTVKNPEENKQIEEIEEKEGLILEEINSNIPMNIEKAVSHEISKENDPNIMKNIERKPSCNINTPILKPVSTHMQQQHTNAIHASQRSYSNNMIQNKMIPGKVFHPQNFGGIMNMRPHNTNHNTLVYHPSQTQIQYS